MGLKGFQLLFGSIITIIEGICVFFSSNHRCARVFKLLVYLGIRAYLAVLPRGLYCRNLLLLEGPFCLCVMAFYKVSMEFPFRLLRDFFKKGMVDVNKNVNNLVFKASCPSKKE